MMLNLASSLAYSSWFQRMSSPRCRIVGFDASDVGGIWEREDGMVEGGAGRPESCGVGVAADIFCLGCDVMNGREEIVRDARNCDGERKTGPKFSGLRMKLIKLSSDASSNAKPRVLPNQNEAQSQLSPLFVCLLARSRTCAAR
jgi:hypothetical protein